MSLIDTSSGWYTSFVDIVNFIGPIFFYGFSAKVVFSFISDILKTKRKLNSSFLEVNAKCITEAELKGLINGY